MRSQYRDVITRTRISVLMAVSDSSSCSANTERILSNGTLSSSDFSDEESVSELLTEMEVRPYQFEPEASPNGHSSDSSPVSAQIAGAPDDQSNDRIGYVDW